MEFINYRGKSRGEASITLDDGGSGEVDAIGIFLDLLHCWLGRITDDFLDG